MSPRKKRRMAAQVSYNNDRSQMDSYPTSDPATGGFFNSDLKKHDDLKQMLDSNKDGLKLEAMKRIIGMVAKGRDASELFPAVVKNVVSSNLEVKKLVYLYLVRYAEEQQDLALLSISTFQRALKDPNPLIRGCALRVLSSIRVAVIVPIMMLAIKETVVDLSPYVRKTTAHAIPKLYNLDPEQKDELIKTIEKLLSDMSTLVVGSAVMAFEEVCPERIDLIHANYRKLCCLLVDVEEWGEVVIINMLTRYARTQFVNPNLGINMDESEEEKPFYDDDDDNGSDGNPEPPRMDHDHMLLLTNTKPLLQSRNAAVVLSVAQLYEHIAPKKDICLVARPLVRLLRGHREIQSVVLTNIASLTTKRKGMFEPFLKSFFIRSCDPTHIKILKLEVMTNIATEMNISQILREFQTYISSSDKEFVAAAIQAIGRCATKIKEVTDSCLSGLVTLLSHRDELVVGESVIVVRKLLQNETVGHTEIISHMARLVDTIKMPSARASILWLLGEYCDKVPKIAPDVLRKMAKSFVNESDMVKLQIMTLATKLYLTNPKQTHLLCQYVFNLAKYDSNYDIRDRARFIRAIIFNTNENRFAQQPKKIFLASKPPPVQESNFDARDEFQLGTLSHFIHARANGYEDLPGFPDQAPDSSVRNPKEEPIVVKKPTNQKSFYSEEESSSEEETDSDESDDSTESDSDEYESSDEESSSEYSSEESEKSSEEETHVTKPRSNLDLLLDDNDCIPSIETPVLTPSLGGLLSPSLPEASSGSAAYIPTEKHEILNRISGNGLSIYARFTRSPHLYSDSMTSIELTFTNSSNEEIKSISVGTKRLQGSITMHDFATVSSVAVGTAVNSTLGIDFGDSINPATFDVIADHRSYPVSITPTIGDLLEPLVMNEADFNERQAKLRGMNEHSGQLSVPSAFSNTKLLVEKIYQCMNLLRVPSSDSGVIKFAGRTCSKKSIVLLKLTEVDADNKSKVTVNSDAMIVTSMLFKHAETFLNK